MTYINYDFILLNNIKYIYWFGNYALDNFYGLPTKEVLTCYVSKG